MAKKNNKPPRIIESDYLKVEPDEQWLHAVVGKEFYDADFYRIIDFFVLHSPCRVSSYSPRSLESMGWKNPWLSSRFRSTFDELLGLVENTTLLYHKSKSYFRDIWISLGKENFFTVNGSTYAVVVYAGESNPRMDILHHIRNAFAHGRFAVKRDHNEYYIFMEDVGTINTLSGLYVNARICLKKSDMIALIDFFEKKSNKAKSLNSLYEE